MESSCVSTSGGEREGGGSFSRPLRPSTTPRRVDSGKHQRAEDAADDPLRPRNPRIGAGLRGTTRRNARRREPHSRGGRHVAFARPNHIIGGDCLPAACFGERGRAGGLEHDRLRRRERGAPRGRRPMMKTLFLNPPSYDDFDGGAGSRYQATREVWSFWYPTWLCYPAGMIPDSRVLDAPPEHLNQEQTVAIAHGVRLRRACTPARRRFSSTSAPRR